MCVCRYNSMHLFEILCECDVYNYKSNISTDLIDINTNWRPLMKIGKPVNQLNIPNNEIKFVMVCRAVEFSPFSSYKINFILEFFL